MAEIALRTYYRQIDQLIDQKHLEEALAHCKNILHHFPKDVEAYRLMGKALLERGRHGDAADVFQRVLSARPDDFISHVGMAIVREDEGNLEAALWHMERAFEASPSNPAVQDELRRLYGRRDGIVPHRAQLTRGALARLYYKQGLFAQSEAELRAGLAEQPDRPDLLTLLVQTLWESNRREEAGALCQDLLERLPYNLEANRVMAQLTKGQNQLDTARLCRQRLEALDPYEAFAGEGTLAENVNADAVRIAEIDYAPEVSLDRPEWSSSLGVDLAPEPEETLPDWVRSGTALLVDDSDTEGPVGGASPDLPEWMRATTGILSQAPTPEAASPEPEAPVEPPAVPQLDTPDWLAGLTDTDGPTSSDDTADWMKDLSQPVAAATTDDAVLPDWLQRMSEEAGPINTGWLPSESDQPIEAPAPTEVDQIGPLTAAALGAAGAGAIADAPQESAPTSSDLPDWLKAASDTSEPDMPDWLAAAAGSTAPDPQPGNATSADETLLAGDVPDWLRGATGQTGMLGAAGPLPIDVPEPANELPQVEPESLESTSDLPDWLKDARPATESAPDVSVPDWLSAASSETGPLGEIPDWLTSETAEVTDVTLPAATVEEPPVPDATVDVRAIDPTPPVSAADAGLPAWLSTIDSAASPDLTASETPSDADDDAFAWLESLAARQGVDPAELSRPQSGAPEALPDWLQATDPMASVPAEPDDPAAELDLPDFLQPASPDAIARANAPVDWEADEPAVTADEDTNVSEASGVMPEWVRALAPSDDVSDARPLEQLPDVDPTDLPDWLRPATPDAGQAAALTEPDPTALNTDDAFAWLEGLAAAQGADPETLSSPTPTASPQGDVDLPDWLRGAAAETPALAENAEIPDWLSAATDALSDAPVEPAVAPALEPAAELPVTDAPAGEDDAFAWLESLAARQGADPDTLSTSPEPVAAGTDEIDLPGWMNPAGDETETALDAETDRRATRPLQPRPDDEGVALQGVAWLREPLSPSSSEAEPGEITLPDWLQDEIGATASTAEVAPELEPDPPAPQPAATTEPAAPEAPVDAPSGPPIKTADTRTALLAGKLAERKRVREAEIQDRFERQRANREAAQREVEQKLAARRAGLSPEPPIAPSDLPTAPLPAMDALAAADAPTRSGTGPLDPSRPRWRQRAAAPSTDLAPAEAFARHRAQLAQGQEREALTGLTQLIKADHAVAEILSEVQAYIGRKPASALAYRTLGDAQMKLGQLQEALASYRAALERA